MIKHFGVSVYVFDFKKRKFLLIKHKKLKKWLQPGGHIELNEDPEEALFVKYLKKLEFMLNY